MEAVIIRLTPYQENDAILNAVTSEGLITFKAKGLRKEKAKLKTTLIVGNIVDLELIKTKSGYLVVGAHSKVNFAPIFSDFERLTYLNLIAELTKKAFNSDEEYKNIYPILIKAINLVISGSNAQATTLIYMMNICLLTGFSFKLTPEDEKNPITYFDIREGGLINSGVISESTVKIPTRLLINLSNNIKLAEEVNLQPSDAPYIKGLFIHFLYFIIDNMNINLESMPYLKLLLNN